MIERLNKILEKPENKKFAENLAWYKKLFKSTINPLNGIIAFLIPLILIEIVGILVYDKVSIYLKEKNVSEALISIIDFFLNEWSIPFLIILIFFFIIILVIRLKEIKGSMPMIVMMMLALFLLFVSVLAYQTVGKYEIEATNVSETTSYLVKENERKNREINALKKKLENNPSVEASLALSAKIEKLLKEKDEFEEKYKILEDRLKKYSDIRIVSKVNELLDEEGIDEALKYMEGIDFQNDEKRNIENSKALLIQADLYILKNEYQKAKETYTKSIRFYRDFSNSLAYVHYLVKQNNNSEAFKQLKIMKLELHFTENEHIIYLGTLANLYSDDNRLKEAEAAYNEALTLRRALAKTNPNAYGISCANTLIMGVHLLGKPNSYLDEAEVLLKGYSGVYRADRLLGFIKKLRKRKGN